MSSAHDPVRFPPGTERVLQKLPVTFWAQRQGGGAGAAVVRVRRVVRRKREVEVGKYIVAVKECVLFGCSEKTVDVCLDIMRGNE